MYRIQGVASRAVQDIQSNCTVYKGVVYYIQGVGSDLMCTTICCVLHTGDGIRSVVYYIQKGSDQMCNKEWGHTRNVPHSHDNFTALNTGQSDVMHLACRLYV